MKIYFATNRRPSPLTKPKNFGREFNPDGASVIRFGYAVVKGNRVDIKVAPEKLSPDKNGYSLDLDKSRLGSQKIFNQARKTMKTRCKDTLIFIHGYNVSFKNALKTAAQIAQNLQAVKHSNGVDVALFSWPSDGSMKPFLAYASDRRDAAASGPAVARSFLMFYQFLTNILKEEECDQHVHLMCHSMGNYVLRHALQEFIRQSSERIPRLFDQIFLMAPDEDDDAFEHKHKLLLLPKLGRRVNVYFNRNDRAMSISDFTKSNPERLGDDGPRLPFQIPSKIVQIDCTSVVRGIVEHNYYKDTPKVVADIVSTLDGIEPEEIPNRKFIEDKNRYRLI
ncbi:MAG: alpha/beta hydrolase [Gammaproteobacteria bacterium]|nr:alpha/beta hydrolase [Gammaproteobacteria bacterium]